MAAHEPVTWTDDTAMAIGLARSLVACDGRVDPGHLGDTFAAAYRAEPWRGYGAGPPQVFAAAARGESYVEAAAAMFGGSGSYGNGAAMRAAPAAVVGHPDLSAVADLARAQAQVTHAHPLGQDGAVLLAVAVAIVAGTARETAGRNATPNAAEDVALGPALAGVADHLDTEAMAMAFRLALDVGPGGDPRAITERVGHGVAAVEAVPAAVAAFLGSPDDPVGVLARAVVIGGDTDTIAAMAGALVGARVGAGGLPHGMLARLEGRDVLASLADDLVAATPP